MRGKKNVKQFIFAIVIVLLFVSISPEVQASKMTQASEANVSVALHLGDTDTSIAPPTTPNRPAIPGAQPNAPGRLPQTGATPTQVLMLGILTLLIGLILSKMVKEDKKRLI